MLTTRSTQSKARSLSYTFQKELNKKSFYRHSHHSGQSGLNQLRTSASEPLFLKHRLTLKVNQYLEEFLKKPEQFTKLLPWYINRLTGFNALITNVNSTINEISLAHALRTIGARQYRFNFVNQFLGIKELVKTLHIYETLLKDDVPLQITPATPIQLNILENSLVKKRKSVISSEAKPRRPQFFNQPKTESSESKPIYAAETSLKIS